MHVCPSRGTASSWRLGRSLYGLPEPIGQVSFPASPRLLQIRVQGLRLHHNLGLVPGGNADSHICRRNARQRHSHLESKRRPRVRSGGPAGLNHLIMLACLTDARRRGRRGWNGPSTSRENARAYRRKPSARRVVLSTRGERGGGEEDL